MSIKKFIEGRIRSLKFTFRGAFLLLKSEHAIIFHSIIGILLVCLGFYVGLDRIHWIIQIFCIGFVLTAEGLNTAVEKLCDFIHPEFNKKIGFIKDISSGAMTFAVIISTIVLILIYTPYFI